MKTLKTLILTLLLALTCITGNCLHVHDDKCGYDPNTDTGCTHVCDDGVDPAYIDRLPGE